MYYFRHKDMILATFNLLPNRLFEPRQLFVEPNDVLYMLKSMENFNKWVADREGLCRPFAGDIFKLGDVKSDVDFVDVSLCLSLKDCFWLCSNDYLCWKDVNLFNNSFSRAYTNIASGLEGFKGKIIKTPSPEYTAMGSSCKFFRRCSDGIYLYKTFGGLSELEYSGVYSEFLICQLLDFLGLPNWVDYEIIEYDDRLFTRSRLFTSQDVHMIDIEDLTSDSIHLDDHIYHYNGSAREIFCNMMVVDALVLNVDRHCENIAMLYDDSFRIYNIAPMFDFDHALFYDLSLVGRTKDYILDKVLCYEPKTWACHSFLEQVRFCCTPTMKKKLETIRGNFKFKNHSKFPMNEERLKMVNKVFFWNYNRIMEVLK